MAESIYAETLRSQGFLQMPPMLISGESKVHAPGPPRFFMLTQIEITHALDETGVSWMKKGLVDLSDLGFENVSAAAKPLMELLGTVEIDGERFEIPKIQ